ncbi:MAG: hypothetical protein M1423_06035 [Acidobacteria bacterium]|nr:hypothetical protein [Acidobacteriota bacterium]
MGKALMRSGDPGAAPISCLLDGKFTIGAVALVGACAESKTVEKQIKTADGNVEYFAIMKRILATIKRQADE